MNQRQKGFTLLELMIVVAVVGILTSIAYPSYRNYVLRSNRGEAKAALMELAQYMERNYTEASAYNKLASGTAFSSGSLPYTQVPKSGTVNYNIQFKAGFPTASEFVLLAVPTGGQVKDECGTLTINQLGQNDIDTSRYGSSSATASNCWRR